MRTPCKPIPGAWRVTYTWNSSTLQLDLLIPENVHPSTDYFQKWLDTEIIDTKVMKFERLFAYEILE